MGFHCNLVFEKRKPVFVFFWGQELIEVPVNGHLLWVIEQYFYYDYFILQESLWNAKGKVLLAMLCA